VADPTRRWVNLERAVGRYLGDVTGHLVYTESASTMPAAYVTVERVGGGGQGADRDVDIEVTVTAPTRPAMWDLAADVESAMDALASADATTGVYVDDVATAFGFASDPPPDPTRRRARATFTLTVRPMRTA